ncbi:hypothetical protein BDQ12DRAFT_689180 [Crucibulum laeve]|uniref:Uncharacterized protein n=1 Tax=Crucibulum laeve TaxID=68775 RepID=A0A5C3LR50_9AGAR|nr:hypothetical protein BDQ12DRAFT_689180 [Crucibulum laeve]
MAESWRSIKTLSSGTISAMPTSHATLRCKHGILTTRHLVIYCPMLRNISFLNSFFCLTVKVDQLHSDRQQAFIRGLIPFTKYSLTEFGLMLDTIPAIPDLNQIWVGTTPIYSAP